jgi:predicted RNA-binding protein YlqC (UPF0109 family)
VSYTKKVDVKRIISPDGRVISEAKSVVETSDEEGTSTMHQTVTVRSNYSSSSSTSVSVSIASSS